MTRRPRQIGVALTTAGALRCAAMSGILDAGLGKAGIAGARRHLFLCIGPDCCDPADGAATWERVKARTRDCAVMRTKAACFRICTEGPWLVVYPDGIWYSRVTPERFDRIMDEHITAGRPVAEWIVARNALPECVTPPESPGTSGCP